jgi:hypothetical protein
MKIHAWNSQPVSQVSSVSKPLTDSTPPPATAVSESPPSHVAVSGPGQLISKLMQLKQEDPDRFKDVVSGLATSLKDTAELLDGRAARRLDSLANKLDNIAQGGDVGQLARRDHAPHHAPHHGHHHGHHHGSVLPTETDNETPTAAAATSVEPEAAADVHQAPTLVPPAAEDAAPTAPWNPPPALRAFGRFGGRLDDAGDREVLRTAFADLLKQLDDVLAS